MLLSSIPFTIIFAPSTVKFLKRHVYTPLSSLPAFFLIHEIRIKLGFCSHHDHNILVIVLRAHIALSASFDVGDYSIIPETGFHLSLRTPNALSWFPFCLTDGSFTVLSEISSACPSFFWMSVCSGHNIVTSCIYTLVIWSNLKHIISL